MTHEDNNNTIIGDTSLHEEVIDTGETSNPGSSDAQIIEDLKAQLARCQADYQNLVRRTQREKEETFVYVQKKLVGSLLGVIDNMERATLHAPESIKQDPWFTGFDAVSKEFYKFLQSQNIVKIPSIGVLVDPLKHEVLSTGPGALDVIILEFEPGYAMGDHVIRAAKVVVGNGQDEA